MIEVKNISKNYGDLKALDDISFEVERGELFGLIGPDGAGKTTLFRILATLQLPDNGTARVANFDTSGEYRQIRRRVGYMPGRFSLYQDLSVEENLEFFATIFGTTIVENYEFIKGIYEQIAPFRKRKAGALSGGMKQKLALSCALIHKPEVLLLDEPTTGVDPVSRKEFWDMLKTLKKENITILVSTPFMDEAARCERIALINKGKILDIDSPEDICRNFSKRLFAVRTSSDMYTLINDLKGFSHTRSAYAFGEYIHYTDRREDADIPRTLEDYLGRQGHHEILVSEMNPGIEDTFIEYMTEKEIAVK